MEIQTAVAPGRERTETKAAPDVKSAVLAGLLFLLAFAVYAPTLIWTARIILSSEDMAHGMCAPLVAGYLVFQQRKSIWGGLTSPDPLGILTLLASAVLAVGASLSGSATVVRFAFLVTLASCALLTGGRAALGKLKFPLLLLLFTFPIPPVLYAQVTGPLQSLATGLSQSALELLGFSALREGNLLELPHYRLSIVEACSGIRSLVTLLFFCCLWAYFMEIRRLPRFVIVALSIPSALILNVVRITVTGVLGEWRPELTQGTPHEILGWICLALGFGLVLLLYRILSFLTRGFAFAR
jgi:exosortase